MTRLLFTGLGKRIDPNIPEGVESNPLEMAEYTFKVVIIPEQVLIYEEYSPNPEYLYYNYKGPMTRVGIKEGYERLLLCTFEEFDQKYQQAMQGLLNHKHN